MTMLVQIKRWLSEQLTEIMEFQQRIWVVSICNSSATDTFLVNEDSFHEPMQWMLRKGYTEEMLQKINHQILRVK